MQGPKPHFTTPDGGGVRFYERREAPPQPPFVPPGHIAFRLLCHASRVGGVIGKSGSIVKQLQQETSAKIRIEDSLPSPDDRRVIFIIASAVVDKKIKLSASKGDTFREEEGENSHDEEEVSEVEVSQAQEATLRVFERVIEVAAETDGLGTVAGGLTSCRLLAAPNQVGSVIGKGGNVVEKIRNDTGCRIKALKVDLLRQFPLFTDEIIEIEGDLLGVKRAIVAVTHCLQDCPPNVNRTWASGSRQFEAVPSQNGFDLLDELPSHRAPLVHSTATTPYAFAPTGHHLFTENERVSTMGSWMPQQEVSFKILCPNDRVGSVIGPGGCIIQSIQADTGASVNIGPPIAMCDVRVVTISVFENPNLHQSMAQNATMFVFRRFADVSHEKEPGSGLKGSQISVGLVIPSNQVGCLLGKGGSIVSEMRKTTVTAIQIHTSDQVRACILENEQVVQITGNFGNVQDALYKVMSRLRNNQVATKSNVEKSSYGRTSSDPYQLGFSLPAGGGVPQPPTHMMNKLRLLESDYCPPVSRPWTSQAHKGVNGKANGGRTASKNGVVELGRSVIVTNTTIEIAVPEEAIDSICGLNGSNLDRIRQISGAKVVMHEEAGKTNRMIVLSGSRDQTLAAQSLLQAFTI